MTAYEYTNAFFKQSEPASVYVGGFEVPSGWWSRRHEYTWAMTWAGAGMTVGDMGCGWHQRPFYGWLGMVCDFCYAVDAHAGVLELEPIQKGAFVVADFSKRIDVIPEASLDRIFCISVLEELINYPDALREFARLLKPDGKIIITMDAPFDDTKPAHEKYKGVNMDEFEAARVAAGLAYHGSICRVKPDDALHNDEFNLMVWRCVLKHAPVMKES